MRSEDGRDGMGIVRPVQWWLTEVLSGRIPLTDAPASIQSWARFPIFEGAKEIIRLPDAAQRKAALTKIPLGVRPYIEAEVTRLWPMRAALRDG